MDYKEGCRMIYSVVLTDNTKKLMIMYFNNLKGMNLHGDVCDTVISLIEKYDTNIYTLTHETKHMIENLLFAAMEFSKKRNMNVTANNCAQMIEVFARLKPITVLEV